MPGCPRRVARSTLGTVGSVWPAPPGVGMSIGAHWAWYEQAFQLFGSSGPEKAGSLRSGRVTGCAGHNGAPSRSGGFAMQPKISSWYG